MSVFVDDFERASLGANYDTNVLIWGGVAGGALDYGPPVITSGQLDVTVNGDQVAAQQSVAFLKRQLTGDLRIEIDVGAFASDTSNQAAFLMAFAHDDGTDDDQSEEAIWILWRQRSGGTEWRKRTGGVTSSWGLLGDAAPTYLALEYTKATNLWEGWIKFAGQGTWLSRGTTVYAIPEPVRFAVIGQVFTATNYTSCQIDSITVTGDSGPPVGSNSLMGVGR